MRWVLLLALSVSVLAGCAHKIAVATLDSTIQEVALAAKRAAGNASTKVTIEITVVNGYSASGTVPIAVVPIGAQASLTQSTRVILDVNLKDYVPPEKSLAIAKPTRYILDLKTGALEEAGNP